MIEKFYRIKELTELLGLSRSLIYQMLGKNEFPKPISLSKRMVQWREKDIQKWINEKIKNSN